MFLVEAEFQSKGCFVIVVNADILSMKVSIRHMRREGGCTVQGDVIYTIVRNDIARPMLVFIHSAFIPCARCVTGKLRRSWRLSIF